MTSSLLFKLQENITTLPTSLYKNILLQILPFLWIQFEQLFYDYIHLPHLAQTSIPKYIEVNLNGLIFPSKSSLNISFLFFDSVIHETGANSWIGGHKKNFTLDFAQQSTTGNYLQMLFFLETKGKPRWTKTCGFLHIVEGRDSPQKSICWNWRGTCKFYLPQSSWVWDLPQPSPSAFLVLDWLEGIAYISATTGKQEDVEEYLWTGWD